MKKRPEVKPIRWWDDGFPVMQSILRPAKRKEVAISHFTINKRDADKFNMRLAFEPGTGHLRVDPGKYVRMHVGQQKADDVMMSDTPMERKSNWEVRVHAHGRVLVAGMGIGMILHPLLDPRRTRRGRGRYDGPLPKVDHVVVVEKNPNVIALVGPTLMRYDGRITIVQSDIHDFNPTEKFDTVYFDIWKHIDAENLPEIAKLHQRWKGRLNRSGAHKPWMSSWMVDVLRAQREEDRRTWGWLG